MTNAVILFFVAGMWLSKLSQLYSKTGKKIVKLYKLKLIYFAYWTISYLFSKIIFLYKLILVTYYCY